jgi:N utilization substance protein A
MNPNFIWTKDSVKLAQVIEELVEERGLDRSILSSLISEGMLAAYEKKYPYLNLKAQFDEQEGDVKIFVEKEVVTAIEDDELEITLKKAQAINKKLAVGDKVWVPFDGTIGRIEILKTRQFIASKIRKQEATAIYNEFKDKEGEIVHGVIHKCERAGVAVKVGDAMAFLPKSLTIPGDKCIIGFSIRALLKEVLVEPRNDNQLILDRSSEEFLQQLLELEIPEIFEKLVEIKKIVRIAGYKSKIIVISRDSNVDPVGTCVGVGGSRIKPILKELGTEKIDIIADSETKEEMVRGSLKPAQIDRVEIVDNKTARVWLAEDQRSLAIGKMGQNIALASKLIGMDIQLMQKEPKNNDQLEIEIEDII